jgi:hypothetical protein
LKPPLQLFSDCYPLVQAVDCSVFDIDFPPDGEQTVKIGVVTFGYNAFFVDLKKSIAFALKLISLCC